MRNSGRMINDKTFTQVRFGGKTEPHEHSHFNLLNPKFLHTGGNLPFEALSDRFIIKHSVSLQVMAFEIEGMSIKESDFKSDFIRFRISDREHVNIVPSEINPWNVKYKFPYFPADLVESVIPVISSLQTFAMNVSSKCESAIIWNILIQFDLYRPIN